MCSGPALKRRTDCRVLVRARLGRRAASDGANLQCYLCVSCRWHQHTHCSQLPALPALNMGAVLPTFREDAENQAADAEAEDDDEDDYEQEGSNDQNDQPAASGSKGWDRGSMVAVEGISPGLKQLHATHVAGRNRTAQQAVYLSNQSG